MPLNYAFAFAFFLLLLVGLNIYFFYVITLSSHAQPEPLKEYVLVEKIPGGIPEINEYLKHLSVQYKVKNPKYTTPQRQLISSFNTTFNGNVQRIWEDAERWTDPNSLFPDQDGSHGQILHAMQNSKIILVGNAPKGTQLKLLLLLEDKRKLYFKPKRYDLNEVINGKIYAGFDRHNSEVFGYYLAIVMNFKWVAPSILRRLHVTREILPVATPGLRGTMTKIGKSEFCFYGKCYYCKVNETVCADAQGRIEGAAILYLDKQFKVYKSPWRRSYNNKKMEWEKDSDYCKKVTPTLSLGRLLDLIDTSIFDFLIQNGDRHRYEVYKNRIILLDNGKGLGNPWVDEPDILAPLYQCCVIRASTWHHLELLSGGALTYTVKTLASFHEGNVASYQHYNAVERRLLYVYATVQMCIGKYGGAKVFK